MRRVFSIVGAALLATTTLALPADAQMMNASGSCGGEAGTYGMNNIDDDDVNRFGETVPALFYQINYSGVPAPTTVGVIVRRNDELNDQVGVASFTAQNSSGTFAGVLRANISPEAQGGGITFTSKQSLATNKSRSERTSARRAGSFTSPQIGGGLTEGDHVFYIYTGEIRDVPETVKDGPTGPRFFADEKGYLGTFSCGVTADD